MQFGGKPLFENVSVKFGQGNRYGLIGANGCGKSTFMKILGGDLQPTSGHVAVDKGDIGLIRRLERNVPRGCRTDIPGVPENPEVRQAQLLGHGHRPIG